MALICWKRILDFRVHKNKISLVSCLTFWSCIIITFNSSKTSSRKSKFNSSCGRCIYNCLFPHIHLKIRTSVSRIVTCISQSRHVRNQLVMSSLVWWIKPRSWKFSHHCWIFSNGNKVIFARVHKKMIIITLCVFHSSPSFQGMHLHSQPWQWRSSYRTWKIAWKIRWNFFSKFDSREVACFDIKLSKVCCFFFFFRYSSLVDGIFWVSKTSHQIRLSFNKNLKVNQIWIQSCFVYIKDWIVWSARKKKIHWYSEKKLASLAPSDYEDIKN